MAETLNIQTQLAEFFRAVAATVKVADTDIKETVRWGSVPQTLKIVTRDGEEKEVDALYRPTKDIAETFEALAKTVEEKGVNRVKQSLKMPSVQKAVSGAAYVLERYDPEQGKDLEKTLSALQIKDLPLPAPTLKQTMDMAEAKWPNTPGTGGRGTGAA